MQLKPDPLASTRYALTANSFARASFVLFGVFLIVEFFVNLGSSLSGTPLVYVRGETNLGPVLGHAVVTLALRVLVATVFNLIPGTVLLLKGPDWADRLITPTDAAGSYIEFTALLAVGSTLLGYYFLIGGLAGLAGSLVAIGAAGHEVERTFIIRQSGEWAAKLIGGLVLIALGRRAG